MICKSVTIWICCIKDDVLIIVFSFLRKKTSMERFYIKIMCEEEEKIYNIIYKNVMLELYTSFQNYSWQYPSLLKSGMFKLHSAKWAYLPIFYYYIKQNYFLQVILKYSCQLVTRCLLNLIWDFSKGHKNPQLYWIEVIKHFLSH